MIYYLLNENLNIVQYISFRAIGAAITALFISFLIGPKIIRTLIVLHYGETIRKNGPESHLKKEGTPTMGGIILLMSIISDSESLASISVISPSQKLCCSLAAWYSAFSFKSP